MLKEAWRSRLGADCGSMIVLLRDREVRDREGDCSSENESESVRAEKEKKKTSNRV